MKHLLSGQKYIISAENGNFVPMKTLRTRTIRRAVLAVLAVGVLSVRFCPRLGEAYALRLYPVISRVLSWMAAAVPFSLDEVLVLAAVSAALIGIPWARRRGVCWKRIGGTVGEAALWMYVWFYWGWGLNYFRDGLCRRMQVEPAPFEEARFRSFLSGYTSRLNASVTACGGTDRFPEYRDSIRSAFLQVPSRYGLSRPAAWQCPKRSCCNALYSSVGVLGYMGPFFAESHLNHDLLPEQYPFIYAHELSHLLGVSSEAEANYWAYRVCTTSSDARIRYSGYFGLFGYVASNARSVLSESDYREWLRTVRPEVVEQYVSQRDYWHAKYSPLLGAVQERLYHFYLKGNNIPSGQKNYAEVIGLLLSLGEE